MYCSVLCIFSIHNFGIMSTPACNTLSTLYWLSTFTFFHYFSPVHIYNILSYFLGNDVVP
jgi:hypothetical protein